MSTPSGADVPLLERLAGLPAALLAGLVGVDEQGEPAAYPLLGLVVEHLKERPSGTCYAALLEALTGIWNAAVRGAVVARLRASGLPADDLLLRLQALSPTLGFQAEQREWAQHWMADPTAPRDAQLVQQCLVRLLVGPERAGWITEAPADLGASLRYWFAMACEDSDWIRLIQWEALGLSEGPVIQEEERRASLAGALGDLRDRQRRGLLPEDLDAGHLLLTILGLITYPLAFPQVTRMVTAGGRPIPSSASSARTFSSDSPTPWA